MNSSPAAKTSASPISPASNSSGYDKCGTEAPSLLTAKLAAVDAAERVLDLSGDSQDALMPGAVSPAGSTEYVYESCEEDEDVVSSSMKHVSPAAVRGGGVKSSCNGGVSSMRLRTLTPADVGACLHDFSVDVGSVLALPADVARGLLARYAWSREKLERAYFGSGEGEGCRSMLPATSPTASGLPKSCGLCLGELVAPGFALRCGHTFDKACWAAYLLSIVTERGQGCALACCPAHADGCTEPVTNTAVTALASVAVAERWRRFELRQFVHASRGMAWCPAPACSAAVVAPGARGGNDSGGLSSGDGRHNVANLRTAACGACGMRFCFLCSREAHEPASCAHVEAWALKCGAESQSAGWIVAHTKKCPACGVRVEKNQGCNHMRCKNAGCGHDWCW